MGSAGILSALVAWVTQVEADRMSPGKMSAPVGQTQARASGLRAAPDVSVVDLCGFSNISQTVHILVAGQPQSRVVTYFVT